MLLAPRPPLSHTKAVCSPPRPPSTSCALTTTDTGHKSGLNYVRHRETVQHRNPLFFFFLSSLERSIQQRDACYSAGDDSSGGQEHYLHFGAGKKAKVEEWRDGGRRRRHRSLHGCCRLRRWSGISSGIRCLLFFFPRLKHLIASLLASEMKTGTGICT